MARQGTWFGGLLPDLGISEALFNKGTYSTQPKFTGSTQDPVVQNYNKQVDNGGVLGKSTATSYGSGTAPSISSVSYTNKSSNNSNSNSNSTNNLSKEARDREKKVRSTISDRANRFKSSINNLMNVLPQYEMEDTNYLDANFGNSLNALSTARDQGLNKLNVSRDNVNQMSTSSIRDLEQDMRNQMMATNMQLGAMGAGDSSASQIMAPYAFSKLGSNARADILGQRNTQLNDIQLKESDLITAYDTEKSTIETEKNNALQQIRSFYRQQLSQLNEAKMNADDMEMEAISNLETGLLDRALNELSSVQDYVRQRQAELDTWTRNRLAQLNDSRITMSNNANFDPRAIVSQELPGLSGFDDNVGDPMLNLGFRRNKQDNRFGQ